jgi:hypothetical protein
MPFDVWAGVRCGVMYHETNKSQNNASRMIACPWKQIYYKITICFFMRRAPPFFNLT